MATEIRKTFQVGKFVYLGCTNPETGKTWYMPYHVRRLTPQYVFVEPPPGEHVELRLKRRSLERWGFVSHLTRSLVFSVELPEEHRKQTLGYLWAEDARGVLGLPIEFTPEMLKDRWREYARKHHPDVGGDPEAFKVGQAAYERLSTGPTIADLFRTAEEHAAGNANPSAEDA